LRDYRLKIEIFQLGAKIAPLKMRRCKCVAHIASPQTPRPENYRVYLSHTRLYVDFSWDSVARKQTIAFGVNAPLNMKVQMAQLLEPVCPFWATVETWQSAL